MIILVTGAYGFLGRYTAKAFSEKGFYVAGCGHGKWESSEYEKWGIKYWIEGDITYEMLNMLPSKPDIIVHCAGGGSVGASIQNPYLDYQKTVDSTVSILEYMRLKAKDARLLYPSSPAVYGESADHPIKISAPLVPLSPYGVHKQICEQMCWSYQSHFGINVSVIRFFSIYGSYLKKQLLWDACNKFKKMAHPIFWGTGNETRDWIYVEDATDLIFRTMTAKKQPRLLNCGSGTRITVRDTLILLAKSFDIDVNIRFNKTVKNGDPLYYTADITEALALGWCPKMPLKVGFKKYVNWFNQELS
ncbi:NAD-dependent epimerase/dehydratase family protein [Desulfoluna spongiiphila]|uniref:NAD-dependent epimerase/dehydratase family protein n=1 Tax=Desulfoluna spongiiphila TaxID=419481 RepID=UPI0012597996|nr:NAD(P)-dependent oxidoreductase [Desulfoluna spongiiphila]VVS90859.1 nad-dependent epimerase/dehydratase [Desulfoluna spongiiphila]